MSINVINLHTCFEIIPIIDCSGIGMNRSITLTIIVFEKVYKSPLPGVALLPVSNKIISISDFFQNIFQLFIRFWNWWCHTDKFLCIIDHYSIYSIFGSLLDKIYFRSLYRKHSTFDLVLIHHIDEDFEFNNVLLLSFSF